MAKHGSRSQMATSISQPCDSMTDLVSDGLLHRLPKWLNGEESACQCSRCRFDLWVRKIPCRRKWPPTPVLLPEKSHGQRSLAGYSPRNRRESDKIERLTLSLSIFLTTCPVLQNFYIWKSPLASSEQFS